MDCPTCGKSLATEQGMRQHHAKVHDEHLPNRTCQGCGTEFYGPKARLQYCDDCDPNAGENNGNYRDATETAVCDRCGSEFEYYPSNKDGVYCSGCVAEADGLLPNPGSEADARREVSCRNCGATLRVYPSRIETRTRGVFCDQNCHGEWLSEHVVGPEHHQWEGGSINYGDGWWQVRREALARDDYTCQHCGSDAETLERNPDVHHTRPVRDFDNPSDAHTLENVVTLCRSCHRRAEEGLIEVPRDEE